MFPKIFRHKTVKMHLIYVIKLQIQLMMNVVWRIFIIDFLVPLLSLGKKYFIIPSVMIWSADQLIDNLSLW